TAHGHSSPATSAALDGDLPGLRGALVERHADLEDPVLVGRLDVLLRRARGQADGAAEGPVAELRAIAPLVTVLLGLPPLCRDAQRVVDERELHVVLGIDVRELGPHDQLAVVTELLHPDRVAGEQLRPLRPVDPEAAREPLRPVQLATPPRCQCHASTSSVGTDTSVMWSAGAGGAPKARPGRRRSRRRRRADVAPAAPAMDTWSSETGSRTPPRRKAGPRRAAGASADRPPSLRGSPRPRGACGGRA